MLKPESLSQFGVVLALIIAACMATRPALSSNHRAWPGIIILLVSLAVLYLTQRFLASYNNILIFGAWLLASGYLLHWITPQAGKAPRQWSVNALVCVAVLLAVPDVNGISIRLHPIQTYTKIGVYPPDNKMNLNDPRSQRQHHALGAARTRPRTFELHTRTSGNEARHAHLLLYPAATTVFRIPSIELMNFLGFDSRRVERFDASRMRQVEQVQTGPQWATEISDNLLQVGPVKGYVWLEVPIDTPRNQRNASPAASINGWRAILVWQLVWLTVLALQPVRQRHDEFGRKP